MGIFSKKHKYTRIALSIIAVAVLTGVFGGLGDTMNGVIDQLGLCARDDYICKICIYIFVGIAILLIAMLCDSISERRNTRSWFILEVLVIIIIGAIIIRNCSFVEQPVIQAEIPPVPTFTSEQQIETNIELLETYLNGGECETAFDELFTERFQESYGYKGLCEDEWLFFTNIELSIIGTPNVPSPGIVGEVVVSIEREHINHLGTPVPTSDRKICYKKLNDEWLIDEMHTNSSRDCSFR